MIRNIFAILIVWLLWNTNLIFYSDWISAFFLGRARGVGGMGGCFRDAPNNQGMTSAFLCADPISMGTWWVDLISRVTPCIALTGQFFFFFNNNTSWVVHNMFALFTRYMICFFHVMQVRKRNINIIYFNSISINKNLRNKKCFD